MSVGNAFGRRSRQSCEKTSNNEYRLPARGAGDSGTMIPVLPPAPRAVVLRSAVPGVPLRSTQGSMLSPATAGYLDFIAE